MPKTKLGNNQPFRLSFKFKALKLTKSRNIVMGRWILVICQKIQQQKNG